MSDRISFHLDENVSGAIALGLRRYGIDVTTTQEVGLSGQADEAQLEFVQREQRVLFTQDSDFLIIASQSLDHPGITYFDILPALKERGFQRLLFRFPLSLS